MNVFFRVDASFQIGSGHVMRCLTLADELRQHGAEITFVCREHPGNMNVFIKDKGYSVVCLQSSGAEYAKTAKDVAHAAWLGVSWQQDAAETIAALENHHCNWLIIDHYAIDRRWEHALRPCVVKIMVIDDLADRPHDCDLLLDQNYYCDLEHRYKNLVTEQCVTLLGPAHLLLRTEFIEAKKQLRVRSGNVKRILVFFGGSDPTNQTQKAVEALNLLNRPDIMVDVVVGAANPNRKTIQRLCDRLPNVTLLCQVSNMAELVLNSDLGVGAGGAAMWERCCLGLPTVTVVFAANQERTTEDVATTGAINYLGWSDQLTPADYAHSIVSMIDNPHMLRQISSAALNVIPSVGPSIVETIYSLS